MLKVTLLEWGAQFPTVGHPGSDLGYDLYALESVVLRPGIMSVVRTGIAASFSLDSQPERKFGLLFKDRSSMAAKGLTISAGVIDAGYTGELKVLITNNSPVQYHIWQGDKIAQMLPTEVFTAESIVEVDSLGVTTRGAGGFGSTGA